MLTMNKWMLLVLAVAIVPLFYVSVWLGLTAAIVAYVLSAKLANRDMDRIFLVRSPQGQDRSEEALVPA
jgi:hypothetical protein